MDNGYEFYYPGVYDKADKKVLKEFQAKLDQVNNYGDININDLVSGKLEVKAHRWSVGIRWKITSKLPLTT